MKSCDFARISIAPLVLIVLAAGGTAIAAKPKPIPPATPAGNPVSCISTPQIRNTRVRDDSTIDFYMTGGKTYRNILPYKCSGLGFQQAFSYSTSIARLCSVDIITVIQQGAGPIRGASCGLGQFQPVTGLPR